MQDSLFGFGAFVLAFPLLCAASILSVAYIGGWAALARHYATDATPIGATISWSSARFGFFANYSNCLTFAFSPAGIYIRPLRLFRIGHKPLSIPWSAIKDIKPVHWLFGDGSQLSVALPDGGKPLMVTLYGRQLDEGLRQYYRG